MDKAQRKPDGKSRRIKRFYSFDNRSFLGGNMQTRKGVVVSYDPSQLVEEAIEAAT